MKQKYRDQLGNEWSVRVKTADGNQTSITFSANGLRLIVDGISTDANGDFSTVRLKELFCDADRLLECRGVTWRVGYRRRIGGVGHSRPGMNTWFTSQHGEVRYVHEMLQFRYLADAVLCDRLMGANGVVGGAAHVRWRR